MNRLILIAAMGAAVLASVAAAETVRCPATRDVGISAVGWSKGNEREINANAGAATRIKLKIWQEFGLADFDVSALKGKRISRAALCLMPGGGHKLGLNAGTDLRWLSLSTVSHDWVEGKSTGGLDTRGHGATFCESSYQKANWGWEGSRVWDVILGNGNTLRFDGRLFPANETTKWLRIQLDPRLVHALVAGASHGLLLMDGSTTWRVNCTFKSRETDQGPYLEVQTAGEDTTPPAAPAELRVAPAPNWAAPALGAAEISLRVPREAFAYVVKINGKAVQRWQIPFAADSGQVQSFPILDLPAGGELAVEVAAVDAAGNLSAFAAARGEASGNLSVPALPASPFRPVGGPPKALGPAKVWAFPEVTKVDPVSGKVLHEKVAGDIRRRNAVWDGATGTVRLAAARGEIVSFQIAVEGKAKACKVELSGLRGPGQIPAGNARLWRNWYVGRQSEYALPLSDGFDVPSADNSIAGQTLQAVTADVHVPQGAKPGDYKGAVTVSSGEHKATLALKVKVYDVTIPEEMNFTPELNCYGGPGTAGSRQFIDSHKLAHYNRCTINRLPYTQGGRAHADYVPKIDDRGHVTDWSAFDRNLSGLLDGSWFADNPRAGVPVPVLYLPFFEGWPKDFKKHYHPGEGVPIDLKDPTAKLRHDTLAKPIEEAMDQAFQDAFVTCAKDFVAHFKQKGWNRTVLQCYLNNKPNWGYTGWTLDEPFEYLDWAAINFFARLWKQAIEDPQTYTLAWQKALFRDGLAGMKRERPTFLFRGDISRPMWQGSVSDGLMHVLYVGGAGLSMPRLLRNTNLRGPILLRTYGGCNDVGRSNWESAAWCLKAYVNNSDGVLPWQSLAKAGAMKKADRNGLIIDAGTYGRAVASFRVHAMRRGGQDCELLRLLQLKNGWSREHIGLLISQKLPLAARFKQAFEDEAAAVSFGSLTSRGFCELKEGVLQLLAEK